MTEDVTKTYWRIDLPVGLFATGRGAGELLDYLSTIAAGFDFAVSWYASLEAATNARPLRPPAVEPDVPATRST